MKSVRFVCVSIIGLAVLAVVLRMLVIKIEPGQAGVLNAEWTGGLVEKDFGPGYHWDVGPLHTWTVFDTTVQTLHMNRDPRRAARTDDADVSDALLLKSKQGATITIDVTLKYRISPGDAWRVLRGQGAGNRYKEKVRNIALDVMRAKLGVLDAEQFYDPKIRQSVTDSMDQTLSAQLKPMGVTLVGILIRDLGFDKSFEERIKAKTLASEAQALNVALTLAEAKRGETAKIEAETEAKVVVIGQEKEKQLRELRAENDKQIREITASYEQKVKETQSDADLYAALKEAEGIKLLREAEAKGQALRRDALTGAGGETLVALEITKQLQLGEITISTQATDPLDVEGILEKLGLPKQ